MSRRRIVCLAACLGLLIALGVCGAVAAAPAAKPGESGAMPVVLARLGSAEIRAEVPVTWEQRFKGLGHRDGLRPGWGMLFLFQPPVAQPMTMETMRFSLDFIWCAGGRVREIFARVSHQGNPPRLITPSGPMDLVIEAPAGWAEAHGVKPGARVALWPAQGTPQRRWLSDMIKALGPAWQVGSPSKGR